MEEVKYSSIHFAIAKILVDRIEDGKGQVSQQAVLQVLKPLLEGHIGPAIF